MDRIREALMRLVRTCEMEEKLDCAMQQAGYTNNPHFDAWGEICDAICCLMGEKSDTLEETAVYNVLKSSETTDRKVDAMLETYLKPRSAEECQQPGPNIVSARVIQEMVNKNGGYMPVEAGWPE